LPVQSRVQHWLPSGHALQIITPAGENHSAQEHGPAASSGETSQASAPEAKEESIVPALTERLLARDRASPENALGGSSAKTPPQMWSPLAKLAQRFLPGATRSSADKGVLTAIRQRSLSELHGAINTGRAQHRQAGGSKGSGRDRGGGRRRRIGGESGGRPSKVPRLTPPSDTPEGSIPRKRKRALDAEEYAVGGGASSQAAADEPIIKLEPVDLAAGVCSSEQGPGDSTPNPPKTRAQWREGTSTPEAGRGGVDADENSEADAAASPPIRTPQQAAGGKLHWQWARTDSKSPLGLKVLVDEDGVPVAMRGPSTKPKTPIKAATHPLDRVPVAEDPSSSGLETTVGPTTCLQVRSYTDHYLVINHVFGT